MWDSLRWLFPNYKVVLVCVLTIALVGTFGYFSWRADYKRLESIEFKRKQEIILKGRADKENGKEFNTNPFIEPGDRDLWRHGWRNSREVKE